MSAWDVVSKSPRLRNWKAENGAIGSLLSANLDTLRSKSRDMVRRNPYAANIIDTIVSNCVGTGIKPQPKLKNSKKRKQIQKLWLDWTDEADSTGTLDFYGLQALVLRSVIESGECLVRLRQRKPEDGLTVPLQLQVLESDHLDITQDRLLPNGHLIRSGIEFNKLGQRVAYHIFREHPGDKSFLGRNQYAYQPLKSYIFLSPKDLVR